MVSRVPGVLLCKKVFLKLYMKNTYSRVTYMCDIIVMSLCKKYSQKRPMEIFGNTFSIGKFIPGVTCVMSRVTCWAMPARGGRMPGHGCRGGDHHHHDHHHHHYHHDDDHDENGGVGDDDRDNHDEHGCTECTI